MLGLLYAKDHLNKKKTNHGYGSIKVWERNSIYKNLF